RLTPVRASARRRGVWGAEAPPEPPTVMRLGGARGAVSSTRSGCERSEPDQELVRAKRERPGTRSSASANDLAAVDRPVPGLARQVVEAVAGGVAGQPLEGGRRAGVDDPAVVGEVDGEALLVHRGARPGG